MWAALLCRLCRDTLVAPVPYELYWSVPQIYTFAFAVCIIPMLAFLVIPNARSLETALVASYVLVTFSCPFVFLTNYSAADPAVVPVPAQLLQPDRFRPPGSDHHPPGAYLATQPHAAKWRRLSLAVSLPVGVATICIAASRGPMILLFVCCLLLGFTP